MSNIVEANKAKPVFELKVLESKDAFLKMADEKVYLKEATFALQQIRGSAMLQKCTPESIKKAIINVALTGVSLNPIYQHAYLVPRKGVCCLDISYKGLVELATKQGSITFIASHVVYDWDTFEYEQGTNPFVKHIPNMNPPEDPETIARNPIKIWDHVTCAYSIARFPNGQFDFIIVPKWRLWKIYQGSQSKDSEYSPWKNWPEEMMRKTAIKYHVKTLPKNDGLARAVHLLNLVEGNGERPEENAKKLMSKFEGEVPDCEQCKKFADCPEKPETCGQFLKM